MEATETKEPTRRERFEAELAEWEKRRDDASAEVEKLERFLALEAGLGITAWRRARRAIGNGSTATDATLDTAAKTWAREDDTPAKACARIPRLVTRSDVETYVYALAKDVGDHEDVKGATMRKLAEFKGKG